MIYLQIPLYEHGAENRLTTVTKNGQPLAGFTYDGDGVQVAATVNGITTKYVGGIYEVEGTNVTKYYLAGMNRVAVRSNGVLNYLLQDHLGSTALVTDNLGNVVSEQRYKAWGETRYSSSAANTDYLYTGQREVSDIGLYFYKARWYDSTLGRFSQADSIVPGEESNFTPLIVDFGEYVNLNQVNLENLALQKENGIPASKFPKNSISLDRYCYSFNNPNYYIDPSGHNPIIVVVIGGMVIGIGATEICLLGIAGALILHNALPGREERIVALATALEDLSQQAASAIQSLFSHKADVAYGDYLADKYGLSKQQRRELHDNITRQGLTKKEIEKEAAELARLKKQNENNQNENDDNE